MKTEVWPEMKVEAKPDVKPEVEPEAKPGVNPEVTPGVQPAIKPEAPDRAVQDKLIAELAKNPLVWGNPIGAPF